MREKRAAAAVLVVTCATACGSDGDVAYYEPGPSRSAEIVEARIDSDAELAGREPGQGVGVFVEYRSGGYYHIDLTCDTQLSGYGCSWWVVAEPDEGSVFAVSSYQLERSDYFEVGAGSVALSAYTSDELDGVSFRTRPGATLRLYVTLDAFPESRFVYWVGDGAVHGGAPAVPFDLVPSEP